MLFLVITWLFPGCQSSPYEQRVAQELARGERQDSLFWGFYLGMSQKDFYARCWTLNKEGLIRQGPSNLTVEHDMKDLSAPATMNFYPTFHEGVIIELPLKIAYKAWAPWNADLSGENLEAEVLNWVEERFGDGFFEMQRPDGRSFYVKVDGNRRITVIHHDSHAEVIFTDLLALEAKKELREPSS